MATATAVSRRKAPATQNAVTLLRADHKAMNVLFADYARARTTAKKRQIVSRLCTELTLHMQLEEEIFYPALKLALRATEIIPEGVVEHETLRALIAQVQGVTPDGEMYEARVKVLEEYVKHHVKEEHEDMFPQARASKLDLKVLGMRMAERKQVLLAQQRGALGTSGRSPPALPAQNAVRAGNGADVAFDLLRT